MQDGHFESEDLFYFDILVEYKRKLKGLIDRFDSHVETNPVLLLDFD